MTMPQPTATTTKRPLVDLLHNRFTAWIVLLASLIITLIAWVISNNAAEYRTQERFKFQVNEAQFALEKRLLDYQQVLRGGLALFVASQNVERKEWHDYVETLELDKHYPGIQGIGFARWIAPKDKDAIEQGVRNEGFPEFTIKPPGERDHYTSIIYLEPFDVRNQRAFGYDMYSEINRRTAMDRARDSGEPAMSGKVKLVQETKTDIQPGFLIYLPLYSRAVSNVEERREALRGFVYSPFRIRNLMEGILGHGLPEINFEIYDGDVQNSETMLYDSEGFTEPRHHINDNNSFTSNRTLTIAGHTWMVYYRSTPALLAATTTNQPLLVAIGGVFIDLLLFYIIISLSRLRQRADTLAKERMEVLRERELHFKTIADTANDGIITCNMNGEISYCNRAAAEIFGYSEAKLQTASMLQLFGHDLCHDVMPKAQEQSAIDAPLNNNSHLEINGNKSDGSTIPLELSVAIWRIGDRRYATIIMRDITERKRIDRMKSEFISTVSHELRTPLTSIRGSLGLISGGVVGTISDKARTLVDTAARNCERLTRLINDILDIEKMEAGQMHFQLHTYTTITLLQHALEHNAAAAQASGIALTISNCTDAVIRVDKDRFQQVMANLISNAIKFSHHAGVVTISCQQHDNRVRIAVQDQGPGVPGEFNNRIFQKFAQADSSDSRQKGGTGLGLSIVKNIVERFGGTIGFETSPSGACFYFDLPPASNNSALNSTHLE